MRKLIFILFLLFSGQSFAESACLTQWNSLKSVQSQLRQQNTAYLREKEQARQNAYQHCRKGKNTKAKAFKRTTASKSYNAQHITNYRVQKKHALNQVNGSGNAQGLYLGDMQNAWLAYYTKPKECIRPKSTKQFAKCLQHRDEQASNFEQQWLAKTTPKATTVDSQ